MNDQETPMDEITLTEMLKEIFAHNKQMQDFITLQHQKFEENDQRITELGKQTLTLIDSFETKYKNIQVESPKPDLSGVNETLAKGLLTINRTIESGPKPVIRQFRLLLFPEQVRSTDYYRVVLTRFIWGILGFAFLIIAYLLLNKLIK
ncbi:MAG: hypothetical protein ACYCZO_08050 [Daejeonella sp.]